MDEMKIPIILPTYFKSEETMKHTSLIILDADMRDYLTQQWPLLLTWFNFNPSMDV